MSKQMKTLTLRGTRYEIVDEQARNTIAGAYRDIRRDCAAAIEGSAEGDVITVYDSSNNPFIDFRILGQTNQRTTTGKQLADFATGNCSAGLTATFENDTLTLVGDGSALYQHYRTDITDVYKNNPGSVLYFTFDSITSTNAIDGQIVQLNVEKTTGTWSYTVICKQDKTVVPYTIPSNVGDVTRVNLGIYTTNNATASANTVTLVRPMLQFGQASNTYEPYTGAVPGPNPAYPQELESVGGDGDFEIRVHSANLCNLPDMDSTAINGVYWAYQDGAITANGTATAQSYVPPSICTLNLIPGTYTVSGGVNGVSVIVTRKRNGVPAWFTSTNGSSASFDVMDGDEVHLYGQVANGRTVINVTIYPTITIGDTPMPFEPYSEQILNVPVQNGLNGIRVNSGGNYIDPNGQRWICDEIDFERGVYIQRTVKKVFDGSESTWRYHSSLHTFMVDWAGANGGWESKHAISSHFRFSTEAYHNVTGYFAIDDKGLCYFATGHTSLDDFKAWIAENPVTVVCKLNAPVETQLTDEQIAFYKSMHTNCPSTTILNDSGARMEVTYNKDLAAYALSLVTEARIQAAVNNWLNANYAIAEEASF